VATASVTYALRDPLRRPLVRRDGAGEGTWVAATAVGGLAIAAATLTGDGLALLGAAACVALLALFAVRPLAGLAVVLVARPSLDLWADRPLATVADLPLNAAAALALVLIAVGGSLLVERWSEVRRAPAFIPFLVFTMIAALSIGVAPDMAGAVQDWLRLLSVLVIYGLAFVCVRTRAELRILVGAILVSAAAPVLVGLEQTAEGGSRVIADFGRATGTFLHPDPYGIFLAIVLALAVPLALTRRVPSRPLLLVGAGLACAALIGSYTRNGWIAFAIALLVIGALRHRLVLLALPVALAAVALAVPSTVARFGDLGQGQTAIGTPGNSLNARFGLWRENLPKVEHHPVLGLGFKSIVEEEAAYVHSDFVRAAVETGVFGFLAFTWTLVAAVLGCWRSFRRSRTGDATLRAVGLGAFAAAAAFLLMSGDSNLMTQVAVAGTAWAIMAAGHAAGRLVERGEPA
jgi:putative inorganic carbon (HCO3(-)) transporter